MFIDFLIIKDQVFNDIVFKSNNLKNIRDFRKVFEKFKQEIRIDLIKTYDEIIGNKVLSDDNKI